MKIIPLSIAKSYVSHWSWWEGIRELLQNAVDTANYEVLVEDSEITIISRGEKIPVSALLMGKSGKQDDDSTIGKFGEGMKLAFLVLGRLGAEVVVKNYDEEWHPAFQYNETFEEECLSIGIVSTQDLGEVQISIKNIPNSVISEVEDKFLPLQNRTPVHKSYNGEAYEKDADGCDLYINGIFVCNVEGKYKYDYNFRPAAFTLDRDRNTAKDFEVRWEASELLMKANQFLLIAEMSASGYLDVEHFKYHNHYASDSDKESMEDKAVELFYEEHGNNAWAINRSWADGKRRLVAETCISKGYIPVEVPDGLFHLLKGQFSVDNGIEEVLTFKPIEFLEGFLAENKRHMRAKPIRKLKAIIDKLKIIQGG